MYHEVGIQALSPKQISRLLNAHPVRVKAGSDAKIQVTADHAKKLAKAGMKGSALTVTLDPFAIQRNQHLRAKGGRLLIDEPFTVRQAFDTVGQLKKSLGLGFEGPLPSDRRKVRRFTHMKGDGFFEDLGAVAKSAGKKVVKKIANEVVQYAGPAAGAAFAAAATAAGQPEFAPAAALVGNELGTRAGRYANRRIQGMGGTLLIDQPFTARQVVGTTGRFIKDPAKTLGFGVQKGKGPKGLKKFKKWTTAIGDFLEPVAKPILGALTDKAVDMIGNYGGAVPRMLKKDRPKRVMSEAQKAALAKGRAALRLKLNEMGAGGALKQAGYGTRGSALMQAGYGME